MGRLSELLARDMTGSVPVQRLDEFMESLDRLWSYVAHDLKNSLSVVRGNAQLAMLVGDEAKVRSSLKRIIRAADDMTELLDEVRCLRQLPAGEMSPIDLTDLTREAMGTVQRMAEEAGVECIGPQEASAMVMGCRGLLLRAIGHLLRNALEAMPKGGTLRVQVRKEAGHACLSIYDSGPGIPHQLQGRIFHQLVSTKPSGAGYGLLLVARVVRLAHKGSVGFTSGPEGTCFWLRLALAPKAMAS